MSPFEIIIVGPPVSQQTRRRENYRAWIEEIRSVAERFWPVSVEPVKHALSVTIVYFFDLTPMDVDNIPKPILDGMKGVVYDDDTQINGVICRRRSLDVSLRVSDVSAVLAEGFTLGEEFLYVVVEDAPNQEKIL